MTPVDDRPPDRRAREAARREAAAPVDAPARADRGGRASSSSIAASCWPTSKRAERAVSAGRHTAIGHLVVSAPAASGAGTSRRTGRRFIAGAPEGAALVRSDRPRRRSRARGLRHRHPHRRRARPELRRGQARGQPARGLRHAGVFRAARHAEARWTISRATTASRSTCRAASSGGWYFRAAASRSTVRVAGNLDCNDGELLHRWASRAWASRGARRGRSSGAGARRARHRARQIRAAVVRHHGRVSAAAPRAGAAPALRRRS